MKTVKFIFLMQLLFGLSSCEKDEINFNSAIVGNWQLIEIGGTDENNMIFWHTRLDTVNTGISTLEFNTEGNYQISINGDPTCQGSFTFETNSTIKMTPIDCSNPLMGSVEQIIDVTIDTLIITNKSILFSSNYGRVDKYFKIK